MRPSSPSGSQGPTAVTGLSPSKSPSSCQPPPVRPAAHQGGAPAPTEAGRPGALLLSPRNVLPSTAMPSAVSCGVGVPCRRPSAQAPSFASTSLRSPAQDGVEGGDSKWLAGKAHGLHQVRFLVALPLRYYGITAGAPQHRATGHRQDCGQRVAMGKRACRRR